MKANPGLYAGAGLVVVMAIAGCASGGGPGSAGSGPAALNESGYGVASNPAPVAVSDFEAIYHERIAATRVVLSEADVNFMTQMIGHHAQAIVMSEMAPTHGANPSILIMAARIINAQTDEIALMSDWLAVRGLPAPDMSEAAHHHHGSENMFGMLTDEQLAELDAARGAEFDRLFLTYMIQHHNGAVGMVEELFATDGAAQDEEVFKFASDTLADQGSEVDRMESMLEALSR